MPGQEWGEKTMKETKLGRLERGEEIRKESVGESRQESAFCLPFALPS